jgi:hypothetical protein
MTLSTDRVAAGQLLSKFLRDVGNETETIIVEGQQYVASKAEILARRLWLMANGGTEEFTNEKGEVEKRTYVPDRKVMELVFTRIEGRPAQAPPQGGPDHARRAGKFDAGVGNRLNNEDYEPESTDIAS